MTATQPSVEASPSPAVEASPSPARERTYTWQDPAPTLLRLLDTPGIEVLQAMGRGELPPPPIMHTLDMQGAEFEVGKVRFTLLPNEFHYNPLGSVHGGVIATLLDSAAGCAVHSVLPAGEGYTSVDLTTKYLRPITAATGLITAEGTVLSRGSRTALAQACFDFLPVRAELDLAGWPDQDIFAH